MRTIANSIIEDGFYTDPAATAEATGEPAGPKGKQRVVVKIPQKVIERAVGLVIFTTMRTGLWISGAGGSGVLVARQEDGSWSPPSGVMLHTAGLGFLVGIDIYDCVLVINNRKALESFTRIRATVGGEISAVAGPVGVGGVLENDGKWKEANRPVFTYLKSRGFYAGVQVDGTIVIERSDENERFYCEKLTAAEILAGKVKHPPPEIRKLMETLKAAEGRTDVDEDIMKELEGEAAPGDLEIATSEDGKMFGIPDSEDPDPFGVLALEKEGLHIHNAGSHMRASSHDFEYHPSPNSPVHQYRQSLEVANDKRASTSSRSSWNRWTNGAYASSDTGTQTGDHDAASPSGVTIFGQKEHNSTEDQHDESKETAIPAGAEVETNSTEKPIKKAPPALPPRNRAESNESNESKPKAPAETDGQFSDAFETLELKDNTVEK